MIEGLNVLMRWLHIASVATVVGGIVYARLVVAPAMEALAPDARDGLAERMAAAFRPLIYAAVCALVISGIYNIISTPGHTVRYHILLGLKLLLVLHVLAVAFLIVKPKNARRVRMMTGVMISGLVIIAISAYLRRIF